MFWRNMLIVCSFNYVGKVAAELVRPSSLFYYLSEDNRIELFGKCRIPDQRLHLFLDSFDVSWILLMSV